MTERLYSVLLTLLLIAVHHAGAAEDELPVGVRSALQVRQVPPDSLSIHVEDVDTQLLCLPIADTYLK